VTARLRLEPLTVAHAEPMFPVLSDPSLYLFLDSSPPESVELLRERYAKLEAGVSPDGSQCWLNWIVVLPSEGPIGFVQATVVGTTAWVAYFLGKAHWSRGYATEATNAMLSHLCSVYETSLFRATVELANSRSIALLRGLGFGLAGSNDLGSRSLSPTECLFVKHASSGSHGI
jgi:ribosomal-protein-alanine N-acetyltransferase